MKTIGFRRYKICLPLTVLIVGLLLVPSPSAKASNEHFGHGKKFISVLLGYGNSFPLGFTGEGDGSEVEYFSAFSGLGIGITDLKWEDKWYRGNFETMAELEIFSNFEPRSGDSAGFSLLLRYNFLSWERLIPYIGLGAGVGYLDFDLVDQEDGLIFYPQAVAGFHYFLTGHVATDLSWRFHHMSNAGTNMPNDGINTNLFLLGLNYYLD